MAEIDFTRHYSCMADPVYSERFWEIYADLRANHPIAGSDQHGGYWAVTRYRHVWRIATDWETFSSCAGTIIPRNEQAPLLIPEEIDPPTQREWRRCSIRSSRPTRWRTSSPTCDASRGS